MTLPLYTAGKTQLLLYGSVHFGKTLLWVGEDALALYLMVRMLELPPALAGGLFLISALLNAACDGLVGKWLAQRPTIQRHAPAMLAVIVPLAGMSFAALPFVPTGDVTAVVIILLLFRVTFSMADVPHNALTHRLSLGYGHLAVARLRAFLAGGASLVVAIVAFLVLSSGEGETETIRILIGTTGLVAIMMMSPLPLLVRHLSVKDAPSTPELGAKTRTTPRPSLVLFCLASAVGLSALATLGKAILHVEFEVPGIGAAALILMTVGRLAAIWIWSPVAQRTGNRQALSLAYLASGLTACLVPWVASSQFGAETTVLLILTGLAGGGIALLSWATLSELIAARTDDTRKAEHISGFAAFTMSTKVALGVSGVLAGAWLSSRSDPLHADPSGFWPLALIVFAMSLLTAALNYRNPAGKHGFQRA